MSTTPRGKTHLHNTSKIWASYPKMPTIGNISFMPISPWHLKVSVISCYIRNIKTLQNPPFILQCWKVALRITFQDIGSWKKDGRLTPLYPKINHWNLFIFILMHYKWVIRLFCTKITCSSIAKTILQIDFLKQILQKFFFLIERFDAFEAFKG